LRLLIHYIGDVHQPLHATSRFTPSRVTGDRGGNSFKVGSKDGAYNLHSVWDSVVYAYPDTPKLPYNNNDWNSLGKITNDLVQTYQLKASDYESLDIKDWATESN
jgi:hypothetical protein